MRGFLLSVIAAIKPLRSRFQPVQRLPVARVVWVAGRSVVLSSTIVVGCLWGIQQFGGLETPELLVFNWFTQFQPDGAPDPRLLIVTITEQDLHCYRWPLSDQTLAQALNQLQTYRPRAIGLDLYRDLANPPGASALATQLQAKNLIAITEIIGGIPAPPGVEPERVGFNDLAVDMDGVLRRNLLFVAASDQDYYSFGLRVSLLYLRPEGILFRHTDQALFLGKRPIVPLEPTSGGYQTADTRGYQTLLTYRARRHVAQTVTLSQVLDGKLNPAWVRDKLVLIGTIAPSLKDQMYTPYSTNQQEAFQMSGVMIHAQMTSQLLDIATDKQRLFQFWTQEGEFLWLWSWAFVGGLLVWRLQHPFAFGLAGLFCVLAIGGSGWWLFSHLIWVPVAEPVLGFIGAMALAMAHRLLYTTMHDPLTGLLNRAAFLHRLGRSLASLSRCQSPSRLGVLFLHLDRLQLINQSLGVPIGDRVLVQVLARWQVILPRSACFARIGDDEVALFLPQPQKETLTVLADQLQDALAEAFLIQEHTIVTTASIGIAVTQPDYHHTPENLLRDAHTAMYRAKASGAARYQVFATGMRTETVDRFTLENELRQGIEAQEFVLYYQPIFCFNTERVVGFEALVRWHHPTQGFVPPLKFIPLAEETGLIIPLGAWICQAACQQIHQWQQQFPAQPLTVSINLSSRQFEQPDLCTQLAQMMQAADIQAKALKLEITESMVMGNLEGAIDLMLRLKALGCKLSMDDFGTGYSSLSQLRRFPIDTLKVDKSFVQKMGESHEDHEIVRMIISLGHTLGMDVVAEGVETQADADALRSLSCDLGQGYFWAKPLPPAEATRLLHQQA